MPSLQALADFKNSFRSIGNETGSLVEQNLPFDDLPLPENEPLPPAPEAVPVRGAAADVAKPGPGDLPDFPEGAGSAVPDAADTGSGIPGIDDFDFSAFLDTVPDDIPERGIDGDAGEGAPDFPPGLLDGLADEIEAGRSREEPGAAEGLPGEDDFGGSGDDLFSFLGSGGEESPEGAPETVSGPEDFDFSDLDLEGETLSPGADPLEERADSPGTRDMESPGASLEGPGDFLSEEAPEGAGFPGDLPDLDLSGLDLSPEAPEPASDLPDLDLSGLDLSLETPEPAPGLPDLDLPDIEPPPASGPGGDSSLPPLEELIPLPDGKEPASPGGVQPGAGLGGGKAPSPEELILGDGTGDAFDAFSLEGGVPAGDLAMPGAPPPESGAKGNLGDLEEFSLAGVDDVLDGTAPRAKSPGVPEKAGTEEVQRVEEIRLGDEDFPRLQKTLASYPLNLRIACEEIITEQGTAPDQLFKLIKLLIRGAPPRETAALAEKILQRTISIPRGFEKKTGEALEEEQASLPYIFTRRFLPVLGLFLMIALAAVSLLYLIHQFGYTPLRANSIYRLGYERIPAGDYARANDRFNEALRIRRVKDWFYRYAEGFRDARQYIYAEEKYDELLRYYPRDKKAVLDYAAMETNYLRNYAKAETLLRRNILDYSVDDPEALLALGDNSLAWAEFEPSRYEDARASYARLLERYGWTDPVVERMMKYFIRTDNLGEVLPLQGYFMNNPKRKISPASLAELGSYLLDKRLEEPQGVPNAYAGQIEGIRNILLRAVTADPALPEPHYHLARYYNYFGNADDERLTLETAARAFDAAREESVKRVRYRIDTQRRYAQVLTNNREFFSAEEQLIKGIGIYEDALSRRLFSPAPEFGGLYADLGDLEYFAQDGNMELALENYLEAEQNGWAPPEIQYRMGSAYYQQQQWVPALERFFAAAAEMPLNRRLLYALGNVSYMRGNYFAAQGYYNRLLDLLETERTRFPLVQSGETAEHSELAERLMVARNNMGVTLEALTERTGDNRYRSRAMGLYTESARAWDALTRNPDTMIRFGAADLSTPGINLAYLNFRNSLYPEQDYEPQIYPQIDKDVLEPSLWEGLIPQNSDFSAGLSTYR
jgi:tetratricopeptide (TPR) repeat protein